jgi:hypothetical protein
MWGVPFVLSRREALLRVLGGLLGTGILWLLLTLLAPLEAFGFPGGMGRELSPELGVGVCLAGYGLTLVGAALVPPAPTGRTGL